MRPDTTPLWTSRSGGRKQAAEVGPIAPIGYTVPFVLIHLGCVAVLVVGASADAVAMLALTYVLHGIGITAGYHRYFSHRSFRTSRGFQLVLAVLGSMPLQKGVLWWVAHHRAHHRHADAAGDPHSPAVGGLWWAHVRWFLAPGSEHTDCDRVRDLARYPELRWIDRYFWVPSAAHASVLIALGGLPWLVWGFFVGTTISWHLTYAVNSVGHRFGRRRYATPDESRNNGWLALVTWGEGWHNNHHRCTRSARQGFFWWEIDLTWYVLLCLERIGVVWDVRRPAASLVTTSAALEAI